MVIWDALVNFIQVTFGWLPGPLYWIVGGLVGISQVVIYCKIVAFILDMIPFL